MQYNPDTAIVNQVQKIIKTYLNVEDEEIVDMAGNDVQNRQYEGDTTSMNNNFSVAGTSTGQARSKNESAQQALFNI